MNCADLETFPETQRFTPEADQMIVVAPHQRPSSFVGLRIPEPIGEVAG
jgi:hypothetical protein